MENDRITKETEAEEGMRKYRKKLIDKMDTTGLENKSFEDIPDEELKEASEDPTVPNYAEETEVDEKIAISEKAGSEEIDAKKDPRFSKDHTDKLDEEALRKNKFKPAKSGS